jgi:hypothetical protein
MMVDRFILLLLIPTTFLVFFFSPFLVSLRVSDVVLLVVAHPVCVSLSCCLRVSLSAPSSVLVPLLLFGHAVSAPVIMMGGVGNQFIYTG